MIAGTATDPRAAEVRRLLDRYLVEVVEAYELCPWARTARTGGELAVDILWGKPLIHEWIAAAEALLAAPATRVAMVLAPEYPGSPNELRAVRDIVAKELSDAGVAEFHPGGKADFATPARLVPYLRRSPDPMLQLVPLSLLANVRGTVSAMDRARQLALLGAVAAAALPPHRGDVADRIAADNHARVTADREAIAARLADIAADRAASYPRVGIALTTSP